MNTYHVSDEGVDSKNLGLKTQKRKGRNSDEVIKLRQEIIFTIFKKYSFKPTLAELKRELKKELSSEEIAFPSDSTLKRDLNKLSEKHQISFKPSRTKLKINYRPLSFNQKLELMSDLIRNSIRQYRIESSYVHLVVNNGEFSEIPKYWEDILQEWYKEDYPISDDILYVFIIFNTTQFSEYVCTTLKDEFPQILFTTSHDYCAELALETKDFVEIAHHINELIID